MTKDTYEDIINLPRHVSERHLPMPLHDRAAQFAPYHPCVVPSFAFYLAHLATFFDCREVFD